MPVIDVDRYLEACADHRVLSWTQSMWYLWEEICVAAIAREAQTPDFLSHRWFKAFLTFVLHEIL